MQAATKLARAVPPTARAYHSYKHRYGVVSKGSGIGKAASLSVGSWSEANDAQSLAKVWPTKMKSAAEAATAVAVFDSIIQKTNSKSAHIGKGKACLVVGDFAGARAAASAAGVQETDKEYATLLALRASIACSELAHLAVVEAADPSFGGQKAQLEQEASETFLKLGSVLPDDWASRMAHGEYLLKKGDISAAPILREALSRINKEVNGRQGKSAMYVASADSVSALADYVDYKVTVDFKSPLAAVLQAESERTDAVMETKLAAAYPGLTPRELVAIVRLDADIEGGVLDFSLGYAPSVVQVQKWKTPSSMEATGLAQKYTGGALGAVQRQATVHDLDAELAVIAASSDNVDIDSVVNTQHTLAVKLAKQVQYRCKIMLAQALLLNHMAAEAHNLANDVITDNAYLDMYSAFRVRAQASADMGNVEAASNDFKKAFALENAFESADIPTMDKMGYREEF